MRDHVKRTNLRAVRAELIADGRVDEIRIETIRKFVTDDLRIRTEQPHARHRDAYEALLYKHHPTGFRPEPGGGAVPPLRDVLPPGEAAALAFVDLLAARDAHAPGAPPPELSRLHDWLRRALRAEYAADRLPADGA